MESDSRIPIVLVVGRAKTGKTTLVVKLVSIFKARGIRVATIKHHPHDFEIDREGKDTYRHKQAGAVLTMIASPSKMAMVKDLDEELRLQELVEQFVRDVDLVIAEGFKGEPFPKIEVYDPRDEPPATIGDPNLLAVLCDMPLDAGVPLFKRDDARSVADLIAERVLRKGNPGSPKG